MSYTPATPEEISELPRRYAIGKRPLSRLLGWGELTYTRLLNGGVPNAEHSDEIRRLLDDPAAYARLLEIGRERKVITGVAYDRSRRSVDALLAEAGHDETDDALKIFAVADRICALTDGDVTPRTLQMLMHVAQERAAANGEPLFDQEPVETEWGFEYPQISAGYSFETIQNVAARLKDLVVPMDESENAAPALEAASGAASTDAPCEPEAGADEGASKKKGKKGKKAKKDKAKKKDKKKDKAAAKAAAGAASAEVESTPADGSDPATEPASTSEPSGAPAFVGSPSAAPHGPLSPVECRIVDEVVARYRQSLSAAFE